MIVFVLLIIVQLKTEQGFSTDYLTKTYDDRQACEIDEGTTLTAAEAMDNVAGWIVVHDCDTPIDIPKKA